MDRTATSGTGNPTPRENEIKIKNLQKTYDNLLTEMRSIRGMMFALLLTQITGLVAFIRVA